MVENKHRNRILLSNVEDNEAIDASVKVSVIEFRAIDCALDTSDLKNLKVKIFYGNVPSAVDEILRILDAVSPLRNDMSVYK